MLSGIITVIVGLLVVVHGVRQVVIVSLKQKVGTYSYPDSYVESLPGIITDPKEKLDSIWPLYKMPDIDRFYIIGKWKAMPSGAPTKSEQTWVQRVK